MGLPYSPIGISLVIVNEQISELRLFCKSSRSSHVPQTGERHPLWNAFRGRCRSHFSFLPSITFVSM